MRFPTIHSDAHTSIGIAVNFIVFVFRKCVWHFLVFQTHYKTYNSADSFFLCCRYNPLWVLAFSAIFFHSVLSLLSFLHPFIPIIWMSSSTSSIYLFLCLSLILLPIGFHSNILLGILPPSIRITCPSQAILLLFINLTMSAFPMGSFSSWFFLILQIQFSSCTWPKIFLNIFRSNILNCCSFRLVNVQASHPYVTAGHIKAIYIFSSKHAVDS